MENGVRRWMVDISRWDSSPDYFSFLVSLLPAQEGTAINRFLKVEDRKRALVSRLLQYSLIHDVFGIPFGEVTIIRSTEGKPFLENRLSSPYPYFNFNVSHSGNYVGIASDAFFLIGMDIVSLDVPKNTTIIDFIKNFKSHFTSLEWSNITKHAALEENLLNFYRYWSLKEAYVKALGTGLSFSLNRLEFQHDTWENIDLYVDGNITKDWEFWVFQLDDKHWASVARGTPQSSCSYQFHGVRSLLKQEFCSCTVEQLISPSSKVYLEIGAKHGKGSCSTKNSDDPVSLS